MGKAIHAFSFSFGLCALLTASLSLCGCGVGTADQREERDPALRRAQMYKQSNPNAAIGLYEQALARRPRLARAHLELGLLYDKTREDYPRAIYHYQRYLELRPRPEKREVIEGLIHAAKLSFAATLPDQPSAAVRQIALLKRENQTLRDMLARYETNAAAQARPASPPAAAVPPAAQAAATRAAPDPVAAQPATVETYVVQPGDTLSRIAAKVYNDPGKWSRIYEANRSQLPRPESVRVGQTLKIPK